MFFQDRKIKYSIRKLSVATVSLAIGFLFAPAALGAAQVAQADELTATEQVENKAENQVSVGSSSLLHLLRQRQVKQQIRLLLKMLRQLQELASQLQPLPLLNQHQ